MRIAVCDDQEIYRDELLKQCKTILDGNTYYECFDSGECLLHAEDEFDLLFLDIEMTGLDGIQVKDILEQKRSSMKIIFLTSHAERMIEAFGNHVIGFLKKPVRKMELEQSLRKANRFFDKKMVHWQEKGIDYIFCMEDIRYIEAQDKYTYIVMQNERYLVRRTMKEWENILGQNDFCKINRSFLINFSVFKKNGNEVILDEDKKIRISRKNKEKIEEQYRCYLKRKMERL